MRKSWQIIVLGTVLAAPAAAQDGDAARGQALAEEHCARCHDIADGGAMKTYPPSFDSIARFRPAEQIPGRIWFPALHTSMPPMSSMLLPGEVDDLTAYIISLDEG